MLRLEVGEVQRGEESGMVCKEEAGEGSFYRPDGETERDGQSTVEERVLGRKQRTIR